VELTAVAVDDLDELIDVLSLPSDTKQRVRRSLAALQQLPQLGPELSGRWSGLRFLLGPWRWMVLVYRYDPDADRVVVITIQDARSASAPTSLRGWAARRATSCSPVLVWSVVMSRPRVASLGEPVGSGSAASRGRRCRYPAEQHHFE
jgi:plasmid stabilization system protein ParE